jgi:hypothetical protein
VKKLKHARRKVTEEQVEAMNRELALRGSKLRYAVGQNGRLSETELVYMDW